MLRRALLRLRTRRRAWLGKALATKLVARLWAIELLDSLPLCWCAALRPIDEGDGLATYGRVAWLLR